MRLFVDTLISDDKYSCCKRISRKPFKWSYLKNTNFSSILYCISWIYIKVRAFWKKMSHKAQVIPKWITRKNVLAKLPERLCFRTPSSKPLLTRPKHCWNLPAALLCHWFINPGSIELQNIPLGKIWNLRTVS